MKKNQNVLMLLGAFFLVFPQTAHAYLDPGTGSMILQGIAAAAIAAGLFWRKILDKIRSILGKEKNN